MPVWMRTMPDMKALRVRNGSLAHREGGEILYPESDGRPMAETDEHRFQMNYLIEALCLWFARRKRVYATGNILLYYEEGDPRRRVSPDVMLIKGVERRRRRVYKLWEEKKAPSVVIEVSSRGTRREDLVTKFQLYRDVLGVREYYIYDPLREYLPGRMKAWELRRGVYVEQPIEGDRIMSPSLGLFLVDTGRMLRLVNPRDGHELRTLAEETTARREAEAEVRRLRRQLDRIRRRGLGGRAER